MVLALNLFFSLISSTINHIVNPISETPKIMRKTIIKTFRDVK